MRTILFVVAASLIMQPIIVFGRGQRNGLSDAAMRSAVLTAAMDHGITAYIFANMYGAARRVAASSVLMGTGLSIVTVWVWLAVLP